MDTQRSTEIKVGAVTLVSLVLLIGGIVVGRGLNMSTGKPTLKILFPNSGGLEVASPVFVNGLKRGSVSAVEAAPNGVLTTAVLDNISDIKTDASAKILMLEITGGKKIELYPGQSASVLASGTIIKGVAAADISELVGVVGEVGDDAKRIVRRLDTAVTALNDLLADGKLVADARQTVKSLRSVAVNADELLIRNRAVLNRSLDNLADVSADVKRLTRKDGKVDSLVMKVDTFLADARGAVNNVNGTLKGADKLVAQLDGLVNDIKTRKSTANLLLYDEPTGKRLDSLLTNLKRFFDNLPYDGINVNVRLGSRP